MHQKYFSTARIQTPLAIGRRVGFMQPSVCQNGMTQTVVLIACGKILEHSQTQNIASLRLPDT